MILLSACLHGPPNATPNAPAPAAAGLTPPESAATPARRSAEDPLNADAPPVAEAAAKTEPPPRHPFHEPLPGPETARKAPAMQFANMSSAQCRAELKRRGLPVKPAHGPARGIATPLRMIGTFGNVRFVAPGSRSVYGMLDCRLVLALDEFARILQEHQVVAVRVDNLYRPKARLPGRRKRSQHAHGLAVDVISLELSDGRTLLVERDWQSAVDTPACGPDSALTAQSEEAVLLRNIVCQVARAGVFHHILTPNFNAAHEDHLHLDIKRDAREIVVH